MAKKVPPIAPKVAAPTAPDAGKNPQPQSPSAVEQKIVQLYCLIGERHSLISSLQGEIQGLLGQVAQLRALPPA